MKNRSARPKTKSARSQKSTPVPVPPQLAGLVAVTHDDGTAYADHMSRAITAARAALRDVLTDRVSEHVTGFISAEAARGPWSDLHHAIDALQRPQDSPLNATCGDVFNVYSSPAILIGMALAYVFLEEGGAR